VSDSIMTPVNQIAEQFKSKLNVNGTMNNITKSRIEQAMKNVGEKKSSIIQKNNKGPRFMTMTQNVKGPIKYNIELSAKSYIAPVSSTGCWVICPDVWGYVIDPICSTEAVAFCASMGPMGVESSSESYGTLGNARLYSKVIFELTCENDKPIDIKLISKTGAVGKEGPLQGQPPSGDFDRTTARMIGNVAELGYMFSGRPHGLAEPGFQMIRFRRSRWIWHYPYYKIDKCNSQTWSGMYQFGGSSFPTRVLWQDGTFVEKLNQGSIENLWISSPVDSPLVNGWWPYDTDSRY
jgi:hypothetical protein